MTIGSQLLVQRSGLVHHAATLPAAAFDERRARCIRVAWSTAAAEREQPVTLQIAECAVVGEHVETIGGAFERGPAGGDGCPIADIRAQQPGAVVADIRRASASS